MKINRGGIDYELTQQETYQAHVEYVTQMYAIDVMSFIINHLKIKDIHKQIEPIHFYKMAQLFYDEKLNEYTNIYAMAKAVIPYLKRIGVECEYETDDFIDSDVELNCI